MLIRNLKFDLRIYVLLAGVNPLRIFLFKEGLARLATHEYKTPDSANINNQFMHLTNYAINRYEGAFKQPQNVEEQSDSHKMSMKFAFELLRKQGVNTE